MVIFLKLIIRTCNNTVMTPESLVQKYLAYLKEKEDVGHIPVTALDYSSLYPSLIMTYNLSPEVLILDEDRANKLSKDHDIHTINFIYNFEDAFGNERSKNIKGWTIRHDACVEKSEKHQVAFGLYPSILKDLFQQRAEMKKSLAIYEEKQEHMEKHMKNYADSEEYQDCLFNVNYFDTKQKALKVYMNCFYGELGNKNSPLFILELAGAITSAGQANLKNIKKFIESKKCKIYYGDTDSLYFSFNKTHYVEDTRAYIMGESSKEDYSTTMVSKTFDLVKSLSKEVNDFLISDNKTKFLKMAYEEVLYPATFLARKKYYGIAHKGLVNFKPKKMFIRGLEVKKRGVSEILRIICLETMWESMCIYNTKSLFELVTNKIDYVYSNKWELKDFFQTALYKPGKKNVSLLTFRERLIKEGRDPPPAYERFNYVIVKINDVSRLYNYKGNKNNIGKGDKMEYPEYAEANNLEIDLDYYFEKQLTGQFARLICYEPRFNGTDDDAILKNCKRYIKNYAKIYTSATECYSKSLKENFRESQKKIKSITDKDKHLKVLLNNSGVEDKFVLTYEKAESLINMNELRADAEAIVKDLRSKKIQVGHLFSTPKYGKSNYGSLIQAAQAAETSKLIKEFITYCDDKKISDLVFRFSGESSEGNIQYYKNALKLLRGIASCIKQKKLNECIVQANLKLITKVTSYSIPEDFKL